MFLLTQSSNNFALSNLANVSCRHRNASALEKNAARKKGSNIIAFKQVISRIFTGLDINNEEMRQITQAALLTRIRPEIAFKKNQSTNAMLLFHKPCLLGGLSTSHSSGLQSRLFHTRAAKRPTTIGGGTRQQVEQESRWSNFWSKRDKNIFNLDQYNADLEKLDENGKKVYMDAFIKGGLSGQQREPTVMFYILNFAKKFAAFIIIGSVIFTVIKIIGKSGFGVGGVSFDLVGGGDMFTMEQEVNVTFDDVCGIEEAKLEVQEIVEYLSNPDRFTRLGARLPKGVLLVGPPGTGKTLLARAIAGEASVPFFHTSGSEFDEVLVGQGAKRVRELFKKARQNAPCVVFIDEIDSVGAKRTSSTFHPYANQTINQLLAEMDGFVQNEGVIVIGATNKKDHLDSALLRPGRFDVHVNVTIPDLSGRKEIFQLYLDKIIHSDCNAEKLAKGTYGFTGADIENMVNQAALKAASENLSKVYMRHLDEARDRILMGPARLKGRFPDEEANKNTAYHEAGHAIVAMFTKHAHPLHKVTIIPRGAALGHTSQLPEKDQLQMTKAQMLADLDVSMGGRVAEELIFGEENITTGAASDLKRATSIAESMVKAFGMSDRVGLRDFTTTVNEMELGTYGRGPHTSDEIDAEIRRVLQESYDRAKELLLKYKNEHRLLAEALLEYETLNKQEVERVIKGEKLKKLKPSQKTTGTEIRGRKQPVNAGTFFPDRRTTD